MQPAIFELDNRYFLRGLRSIAFAASAAFAVLILIRAKLFNPFSDGPLLLAGVVYLTGLFLIARTYRGFRHESLGLRVHERGICIPRLLRGPLNVQFDDIKSVELIGPSESPKALIIGRYSTASVFVETRMFSSPASAKLFADLLKERTNRVIKTSGNPAFGFTGYFKHNVLTVLTTVLLLLAYLITSEPQNFEFTDQHFIDQYGLTKTVAVDASLYRLASSFFVHVNPVHLLINLLVLTVLGRQLERILGAGRLLLILLVSTLAGALTSLQLSSADVVVGASGGIFGLFGAYVYIRWRFKAAIPGSSDTMSSVQIAVVLVLELIFDLTNEGVDLWSHVGGFVGGLAYAYTLSQLQGSNLLAALNTTRNSSTTS